MSSRSEVRLQNKTAGSPQDTASPVTVGTELDSEFPVRRRRVRRRTPSVPWTLYRYVGLEVFRIFLISLLVISILGTVVLAFQLTRSGIRLGVLWPVLQKSLAYPLFFSLPLSLLFSVTLGVGRLAGDLEISAMKANGLSQTQIAAPLLVMAGILSGTAGYINGEVVPVVHYEKGNLRDAIIAQLEDLGTGRNRSLLLPGRVRLFVENYNQHRFHGIRLELPASLLDRFRDRLGKDLTQARGPSGSGGGLTLFARECELEISPDRARVFLNLAGVEVLSQQRVSTENQTDIFRQKYSISNLRLPLAFFEKGERVKDRSWSQLFAYVEELELKIVENRDQLEALDEKLVAVEATDTTPAPASSDDGHIPEKPVDTETQATTVHATVSPKAETVKARLEQDRRYFRGQLKSHVRRQNRATTEIHRRAAFSFACFSFLFIGLPFVFLAERRSRLIPFFYTNVFVVLPFFLLVMVGVLLGERGFYPAIMLAIPNLLLMGVGAYLWSRVLRR